MARDPVRVTIRTYSFGELANTVAVVVLPAEHDAPLQEPKWDGKAETTTVVDIHMAGPS